jgi:hypothetical protein
MSDLAFSHDTAPVKHSKLKEEMIKLFWTFLYLFLLFGTLVLFRAAVLQQHGINETRYGLAVINALVFAKVMLIGDWFKIGARSDSQPLLWSVLAKSAAFAALFIVFHFVEEAVVGAFKGEALAEMAAEDAAKLPVAMISAVVFMITLIPFFAMREIVRVLGPARVRTLLLETGGLAKLLGPRPS